jgi:hypothetical protein
VNLQNVYSIINYFHIKYILFRTITKVKEEKKRSYKERNRLRKHRIMSETTFKYSGVLNINGKEEHFSEFEIKLIAPLETKDLEEQALSDMKVFTKEDGQERN